MLGALARARTGVEGWRKQGALGGGVQTVAP
jgi:hypothetical protein